MRNPAGEQTRQGWWTVTSQLSRGLRNSIRLLRDIYMRDGWWTATLRVPRYGWEGIKLLRDMRLIAASGLFDGDWYSQQNPDVAKAGVNPLRHYLRRGAKERRDPNPYFDSDWYLQQNSDVAKAGVNPLRHYLRRGAKEGRDPSPYFDSKWYLQQNPDVARAGTNPLAHYLRSGATEVVGKAQSRGNSQLMAPSSSVRRVRLLTTNKKKGGLHIGIGLVEHFGDIVACEPVVRYLRKRSPEAEISWVVREPYRELLESNPYIDRTIAVGCLTDWIKLVAHSAFDQVVDLHVNKRICQRCKIPLSKTTGDVSITGDNYFNYGSLLRSFCLGAGLPPLEEPPRVYISDEVVKTVDALGLPDKFVVFHCRSNEIAKDWDAGKWNALAEHVVKAFRTPVVEVGSEAVLGSDIPNVINLCGKTSLLETAEVIKRAALFVGVDSGPAHLANAVNTYGIVIMGRVGPFEKYNPYTGCYADGSNAILIRNENGPASDTPWESVQQAMERKLNADQMDSGNLAAADKTLSRVKIASRESLEVLSGSKENSIDEELPRLIAFYLPQYYPIPENDEHWGKGFTEWRSVGKSRPFFEGQYQPRLPGELGYYDLRVPEIMERQAALAQEHGIHGFCYYLYWFQGKKLLSLPVDNMLRQRKPNLPFCFCWANENWTRRWDGMEEDVLMAQNHTPEDDIKFIRHFISAFDDSRYIWVNGRPLLLIYRTELFSNPLQTVETWRSELRKAGLGDPYLVRCEGFDPRTKPEDIGFDASYEVPTFILPDELLYDKVKELNVSPEFSGRIYDYEKIVRYYSEREDVPYKRFKGVMLAWDNTPRHGKNAVVFHNVTPEKYGEWLRNAMLYTMRKFRGEERLVFINAWNEWAEGNYLDPDLRFGTSFLEATKSAHTLMRARPGASRPVLPDFSGSHAPTRQAPLEEGRTMLNSNITVRAAEGVLIDTNWEPVAVTSQFLDDAETYHKRYYDNLRWRNNVTRAFRRIGQSPSGAMRILDIGSGSGNSVFALTAEFPNAQIVASDISPQLLGILRRNAREIPGVNERLSCYCFDLHKDFFEAEQFDYIVGASILHHMLEPEKVLANARKWLRNTGYIILFEPMEPGAHMMCAVYHVLRDELEGDCEADLLSFFEGMIWDYEARFGIPRVKPWTQHLDDKWFFTPQYFRQVCRNLKFPEVIIEPTGVIIEPTADTFTFEHYIVKTLRLSGRETTIAPSKMLNILREFDSGIAPGLKRRLMTDAIICLRK